MMGERPDWNNENDRKKYDEIWDKCFKKIEITEAEHDFLVSMYHQDEFYTYGEL